jgi:aminoglycoside phosphotransferase (APT) family kinase protein
VIYLNVYINSWYSALETLGKLHRVDFKAIGLGDYGRNSGFYDRQIKSLGKVSHAQAQAKDEETGESVDPIPRLDEMFTWFKRNQVRDEATIVHGDFKVFFEIKKKTNSFYFFFTNRAYFRLITW